MTVDQTPGNEEQSNIAAPHITQGIGTTEIALSATHSTSAIKEVL